MKFKNEEKNLKEELLNKILQNPEDENNYIELGKIHIMNAEYEEALGVYENLLKINGMNAQALINAGSIQFYFGNMNAAINYYSRACEIETNNYTIYLNLGNAYAELR